MSTAAVKFESPVSAAEFSVHVNDPIAHLMHCHQRIERSLITVKNAVAALRLTDPVLRVEGAAALDYELALLQLLTDLHTADEEESLFPRLRRNLADDPDSLKDLMLILENQHRDKQLLFRDLAMCVRRVSAGAVDDDRIEQLESLVGQFENIFRPHMMLEDERLMPQCRQILTQRDLDEMQKEMRGRYQT